MKRNDTQVVMDALRAAYGDASQTVLDQRAAGAAMGALRERGWASLPEVAALVLAAGGELRIDDRDYLRALNGDVLVEVSEDPVTLQRIVRARVTA